MTDGRRANGFVLTITCPDAVGIVAAVSGFLAGRGIFIVESAHFGDMSSGRFFMRTVFLDEGPDPSGNLARDFAPLAQRFAMEWAIHDAAHRPQVMILASRLDHCLADLLHRYRTGALAMQVAAVVSNHPDHAELVAWHGIPYFHFPVSPDTKPAQEARILDLVAAHGIEIVVLARYMQVLTPATCDALFGRAINIHHSFLPGFKGARPYHQAHDRGVKVIGATAHYVTADLDDGPIIEQETVRVDHTQTPQDLIAVGRDIETAVLARALKYHIERRVLINGNRTVVFR